jgi:hypothetical protein
MILIHMQEGYCTNSSAVMVSYSGVGSKQGRARTVVKYGLVANFNWNRLYFGRG